MKEIPFRLRQAGMVLIALFFLLSAGCETPRIIPGASLDLLRFIQEGKTTREEIVLKLGQPAASFEQEKILTYRLGEDPKQGYFLIVPNQLRQWQAVAHSLVLVFGADGVLQKHSLVKVQ